MEANLTVGRIQIELSSPGLASRSALFWRLNGFMPVTRAKGFGMFIHAFA